MKSKINLLAVLFLAMTFAYTSCSDDDEKPAPVPTATTGGLVVKVKVKGQTGFLTGADAGLATSQENLDNEVYLQDKETDANGQVDFGQLNPGNYYFYGFTEIGNDDYYGEGQAQIAAGKNLVLTLELEIDN